MARPSGKKETQKQIFTSVNIFSKKNMTTFRLYRLRACEKTKQVWKTVLPVQQTIL